MNFFKKYLDSILLTVISLIIALFVSELFIRWYDDYQLTSLTLTSKTIPDEKIIINSVKKTNKLETAANNHVKKIPVEKSVNRDWYYQLPPVLKNGKIPQKDIVERIQKAPPIHGYESSYVWNYYYIKKRLCEKNKRKQKWLDYFFYTPDHKVYAYKPANQLPHPSFRFLPNRTDPAGLVVNNVGFRGHDISLEKSKQTIRLAFVGASTTVSASAIPHSYPELVEHWLSIWAKQTNFPYQIEVINAGRSGIASPDIAQVVVNEVLPLNPDYIFYYEGSNEFHPKSFLGYDSKKYKTSSSSATFQVKAIEQYSALAKRYYQMSRTTILDGDNEPKKPDLATNWPSDLDEFNPDIFYPKLPVALNKILSNLDIIRKASAEHGVAFVPMSFVWLPFEGMKLDMPEQTTIYTYLNHSMWPFKYAWIRRLADFQNRVFKKYSDNYNLDFIDVDAVMPKDPKLFTDAIHNNTYGVRLRAWVVFQQIVQILDKNRLKPPLELKKTLAMENIESNIFMLSRVEAEHLC